MLLFSTYRIPAILVLELKIPSARLGIGTRDTPCEPFFLQCLTRASERLFANMLPRYAHGVCEVMLVIKTMACLPSPSPSRPTWPTRQATWTAAENAYAHAPHQRHCRPSLARPHHTIRLAISACKPVAAVVAAVCSLPF